MPSPYWILVLQSIINHIGCPTIERNAMENLVQQFLQANMIRPSVSPYASLFILVKKKDGIWRFCVDYRKLSSHTVKNKYPIPIIEDLLDELFVA